MTYKIGFYADDKTESREIVTAQGEVKTAPVKSVVQVYFPERNREYAYYNDTFDLHNGDIVYVDGKLEGLRGRVVNVSYNFKIKLSDYKRVIGKADVDVKGELHIGGSHLVSFDSTVIPYEKIITWFKAPKNPEEEYVQGEDNTAFPLSDLSLMNISPDVAERGSDYYLGNRVAYICLDGTKGKAIVEGGKAYELEFTYQNGEVSNLVCDCFCGFACKHQLATMLQLRETLEYIEENHRETFAQTNYFSAVNKKLFYSLVMDNRKTGSITLG